MSDQEDQILTPRLSPAEATLLRNEFFDDLDLHIQATKKATVRLEKLQEQARNGNSVPLTEKTGHTIVYLNGKTHILKPVYIVPVSPQDLLDEALYSDVQAALFTFSKVESHKLSIYMSHSLIRFMRCQTCSLSQAYGALIYTRFNYEAAVKYFPRGMHSSNID
ncbi:hypothetical protein B7463_g2099, partial [Scytalidium lignicola]